MPGFDTVGLWAEAGPGAPLSSPPVASLLTVFFFLTFFFEGMFGLNFWKTDSSESVGV